MTNDPARSRAAAKSADPSNGGTERSTPRRITSRDLLAGARELLIEHDGRHYVLRITQNGKLILTA
jgi:hemin uptake protein HemP